MWAERHSICFPISRAASQVRFTMSTQASTLWACHPQPISGAGPHPRTEEATERRMRGWKTKAFVVALALCTPAIASAGWQDVASSFDQRRLARLDASRATAMSEVGDVAAARAAL